MLLVTSITESHENFYIPEIKKLAFHLPHVRILGTHHCGKERRYEFKLWENVQDVSCRRDYSEQLVYSFDHQIQS